MSDGSIGFHPANLDHQPFPHEAVKELAAHAVELGIQFKIAGMPFGAEYNKPLWDAFWPTEVGYGEGNTGLQDAEVKPAHGASLGQA